MRIIDCEQGTEEWFAARRGIPTASMFEKILTPTGKRSTQADGYANQLVAEILSGATIGWAGNQWTDRGTELEPEAREYYEFVTDTTVEQVGFCLRDRVGCSPDGLVGEGGLEIKCPAPGTHVEYLLADKVPTKYLAQVQGTLYVTQAKWWDFLSYCPGLPPLLKRVQPDTGYQVKLHEALTEFLELVDAKLERLKP